MSGRPPCASASVIKLREQLSLSFLMSPSSSSSSSPLFFNLFLSSFYPPGWWGDSFILSPVLLMDEASALLSFPFTYFLLYSLYSIHHLCILFTSWAVRVSVLLFFLSCQYLLQICAAITADNSFSLVYHTAYRRGMLGGYIRMNTTLVLLVVWCCLFSYWLKLPDCCLQVQSYVTQINNIFMHQNDQKTFASLVEELSLVFLHMGLNWP